MKLKRIAVRHFRKLADPVAIDGIGDGLTVIAGDNEEGKSTLLEAIKAALFAPAGFSGVERRSFNPGGRDGLPSIEIGFEQGGESYRLSKVFRRLGAVLETPKGRLEGDAAETRLRDLLRFERAASGAGKIENRGLQAVFWVDQATSFDLKDTEKRLAVGRDRFKTAIEGEVGDIAVGSGGRQLLEKARERRQVFFGNRGKPVGDYAKALELVGQLEEEVAELSAKLQSFEAKRRDLLNRQAERQRFIARDPLPEARLKAERAAQRRSEAKDARLAAERAIDALKAADAKLSQMEARALNRRHYRDGLERLDRQLLDLERSEAELKKNVARSEQEVVGLVGQSTAAAKARNEALILTRRIERGRRRREVEADRARLEAMQASLDAAQTRRRRLLADLAVTPIDRKALANLQRLEGNRSRAEAVLAAVATELRFEPEAGRSVRLDGRHVDLSLPLRLTGESRLDLEGFGSLVVVPGGDALATRSREAAEAEQAIAQALAVLGAADLKSALAAAARREQMAQDLVAIDAEINAQLAAAGVASLAALQERLDACSAELATLPDELKDEAGEALPNVEQLQAAETRLAGQLRAAESALSGNRSALAEAKGSRRAMAGERDRLAEQLASDLAALSDQALETALESARAEQELTQERRQAADRVLAAADPEAAEELALMAERAVRDLEAERLRLDKLVEEIANQLRGAGDMALGQALADRQGRLELARVRAAAMGREAEAWRLLADELEAAARSIDARMVMPVTRRLQPYLARLFADAELVLDPENLMPLSLTRAGEVEAIETLSVGTREQIAILVRLALAQLLYDQEGEAPCLILDDALVYADETRFETMKVILQRAAQRQQIIILTCRPRDYVGLDAALFRLEDCRLTDA